MTDMARTSAARDRVTDQRAWSRARAWWHENGVVIVGLGLVIVAIYLTVLAGQFYNSQSNTRNQARAACQRTLLLAPYSTKFLRDQHVYPKRDAQGRNIEQIALSSIPKSCS